MAGSTGTQPAATAELDVLIVGAGFSGIGCAYYLQREHPDRRYAILEARSELGGTWDLFRFPGVRSDSDLHTFGYAFKPWTSEREFAAGPEILEYIREAARENDITPQIRFRHRVISATWSSETARWSVEVDSGERAREVITARWLFVGTGYFRYDHGYQPPLPGIETFDGTVVHPQRWPAELDYAGKRVVIIGSGATAVTLVPALAADAGRVTMLQRSPSYVLSLPSRDPLAGVLKRIFGGERGRRLIRRKNTLQQVLLYRICQRWPGPAGALLRWQAAAQLPRGYPVKEHFKPRYGPWDERLCVAPDGDFFKAIKQGRAEVVTDTITTFTNDGIKLASGRELRADVVVTATGLEMLAFGEIAFTVDGRAVKLPELVAFKGMMLSGMPNFAYLVGYTNASWTLKLDLVCGHFCRLLTYMDQHGYDSCTPQPPDPGMGTRPLIDLQAGYVLRALDALPRTGTTGPWQMAPDVEADRRVLADGPVEDRELRFLSVTRPAPEARFPASQPAP